MFLFFMLATQAFSAVVGDEDLAYDCVLREFQDICGQPSVCWFLGHARPLDVDCSKLPEGLCIVYQNTKRIIDFSEDESALWSQKPDLDGATPFVTSVSAVVSYKKNSGHIYAPTKLQTYLTLPHAKKDSIYYVSLETMGNSRYYRVLDIPDIIACSQPPVPEQKFILKGNAVVCSLPDCERNNVTIEPRNSYTISIKWSFPSTPSPYLIAFPEIH